MRDSDRVLDLAKTLYASMVAQNYHHGMTARGIADKAVDYANGFWEAWDAKQKTETQK